jgi:hypothetical protein
MEIFSPRPYFAASLECDQYRPKIKVKTCLKRSIKNKGYSVIRNEIIRNKISGDFIGLEASYADHVVAELAPYISSIVTCEKEKTLSKKLDEFYPLVNSVYKKHNLNFIIDYQGKTDIFKYLRELKYKSFSFFDFDFNSNLSDDILYNLIELVPERVSGKSIFSLWNSYGRGITLPEHKEKIAHLIKEFSYDLKVTELEPQVYDESTPMFLQILILEEKENDY